MINRATLNTGLKLASVAVVAAVTAMHTLGDGPITTRDIVTLAGAAVVAVFGYLHTAPADQPPKVAPPAP